MNAHFNLGVAYADKADYIAAINEYREAKRLDPSRLDAELPALLDLGRFIAPSKPRSRTLGDVLLPRDVCLLARE